MCRAARKLGAGKPKPPLKLLSAYEKQLLDTRQIATRLHEHIACSHDGKTITCDELKKQVHENAEAVRLARVDVCDIPSKGEITATFAHMSLWKTFGEDNLPPTLFNALATVYHPLFVKCAMWIERPIQWKGCHLAFFFKKSSTKPICAKMREIGLAPVPAKCLHRLNRNSLLTSLKNQFFDTQFGGIFKRGTDMASHRVRLVQSLCLQRRISVAFVFVDVVSAFYTTPRTNVVWSR